MNPGEKHEINNLGDGAWWSERTGQVDLYILKSGDVTVWIQARGQNAEQAQAIAKAVVEKL